MTDRLTDKVSCIQDAFWLRISGSYEGNEVIP